MFNFFSKFIFPEIITEIGMLLKQVYILRYRIQVFGLWHKY